MQLTCDLSGLARGTREQFLRDVVHEDKARYALGLVQQTKLKKLADAVTAAKFRSELRPQMVMSEDQWKRTMNDYGQHCFLDPDFVPWLLKRNEDMRIRDTASKIQVGWTPALKAA